MDYVLQGQHVEWCDAEGATHTAVSLGSANDSGAVLVRRKLATGPSNPEEMPVARLTAEEGVSVHPVHVRNPSQLTALLEAISYPGDGHEPDESECDGQVYGLVLNNGGAWPMDMATHVGVTEPEAGCPTPVTQPDHTELYLKLTKDKDTVGYVNLAALLAWVGMAHLGQAVPPPRTRQASDVPRVDSPQHLAAVLSENGYPDDGRYPYGNGLSAHVYGTHLDTAGFWPIDTRHTTPIDKDPGAWVLAGCPRPIEHPTVTELYMTLRKHDAPLAHVNLSLLLVWAAWSE